MKQKTQQHIFTQLQKDWQSKTLLASLLLGLTVFAPLMLLVWFYLPNHKLGFGLLLLLVSAGLTYFNFQNNKPTLKNVLDFLDSKFPKLEFSSFLLLKAPSTLNALEKIQLKKVEAQYYSLADQITLPVKLREKAIGLVVFMFVAFATVQLFSIESKKQSNVIASNEMEADIEVKTVQFKKEITPALEAAKLKIVPPNYTGLAVEYSQDLNVSVAEMSNLYWQFSFIGAIKQVYLQFTDGKQLLSKPSTTNGKQVWSNRWQADANAIYQLVFTDSSGSTYESSYYKVEVIEDKKPSIDLNNLPQYQAFEQGEAASFQLNADVQDDYGLRDAYIVATISRGSGESVKFREERIELGTQFSQGKKLVSLSKQLDLYELGAEAGDELYFYLEAVDNKYPESQKTRTETYFAILKDSTQEIVAVEGGLGVDFMPEYFRSQRQLIIDTEKLIAQRGKIPKKEFDETSNGIAYDQKVLRLRYGEFLGEEFESEIGGSGNISVEDNGHDHHDHDHDHGSHQEKVDALLEEHSHLHDNQSEMDRGVLDLGHEGHNHGSDRPDQKNTVTLNNGAEVSEDLVHTHDSEEAATFYFDATKAKLRAALSLMWESELHLRMNEPEKALPVEYKILKLLKEVQQKSRIYVERIGFEPPPIKETKRLQGELDEIISPEKQLQNQDEVYLPAVRDAIAILEKMKLEERLPLASEQVSLTQAGNEIATLALESPNKYLNLLREMEKLLSAKTLLDAQTITVLQSKLLQLLPADFHQKFEPPKNKNRLEQLFIKEINSLS